MLTNDTTKTIEQLRFQLTCDVFTSMLYLLLQVIKIELGLIKFHFENSFSNIVLSYYHLGITILSIVLIVPDVKLSVVSNIKTSIVLALSIILRHFPTGIFES